MKVIWLVISGLRVDHLGAYGNRWLPLGQIDQLAAEGKVFTDAKTCYADGLATRIEWLTGQASSRFDDPYGFLQKYPGDLTLPAQLVGGGFKTALLTDNYPTVPIYEQLEAFDTLVSIPGQGGDRHVSENFEQSFSRVQTTREIVTGSNRTVSPKELERYGRNRVDDTSLRRPAERLFDAAGRFLDSLEVNDDWFILIDAFGLTPPWNAPNDFAKYRQKDDLAKVAWPIPGVVDLNEPAMRNQINFCRRAYADQCLYINSLVRHLAQRITRYFDSETFRFLLMSDQGTLIGDDNFLLENPGKDHPALNRQVLIALGHDIDDNSYTDESVAPVDLFTTTLEKTGINTPPASDGKTLQNL